ncbi:uncharacterized protein STEHIDRAFT_112437 [Stereum hirsutum FP-91666 SS1]|uniref:uncharacterized protein n=1 Tax=Stereum hirsutum (strain FP-91666) TaxID=721885 RepID=UPI0004449BA5|nr:uncharacterized protein STEHIDRAFT_112437 [Stereum hirsutum FP-91666 SS1]EIM84913.1 hypothetical protein STEHIDRAFT_112437 [Stereum hirsutum FP-91666 SS1]
MSFFIRATLLSSVLIGSIATTFASPQPIDKRANPSFQADGSINAAGIYSAASSGSKVLATYAPDQGVSKSVKIYGDWQKLSGVSAYYFKADMDIDCDGPDYKCDGSSEGDPNTAFGALDARYVPYIVLPETFATKTVQIKGNALSAVICNGKMFYGIFGDEKLISTPWLFTDIVFPDVVPSGDLSGPKIDLDALKTLGDKTAKQLASALKL